MCLSFAKLNESRPTVYRLFYFLYLLFYGFRATTSVIVFYTSIFTLKAYFFSILHIHFYKTPTLVYLFYHHFYFNNQFSQIFYYFSQLSLLHTCALSLFTLFFLICCSLSLYLSLYPSLYPFLNTNQFSLSVTSIDP